MYPFAICLFQLTVVVFTNKLSMHGRPRINPLWSSPIMSSTCSLGFFAIICLICSLCWSHLDLYSYSGLSLYNYNDICIAHPKFIWSCTYTAVHADSLIVDFFYWGNPTSLDNYRYSAVLISNRQVLIYSNDINSV